MPKKLAIGAAAAALIYFAVCYVKRAHAQGDKAAGGPLAKLLDLAQVGSPDRAARSNQGWRETYYPTEGELTAGAQKDSAAAARVAPLEWSAL